MPQVPAYDLTRPGSGGGGGKAGGPQTGVSLPDAWFAERVSEAALYQAVRGVQANRRQGTASTRSRSFVAGSTAKPWRQKGTGRARAGSRKSPIWRGGGTVFGPTPRDYGQKLPKRLRRLALRSALRQKLEENALFAVRLERFEKPQTARLARALASVTGGRRALLLTAAYDENLFLSGRNIPGLTMKQLRDVNAHDVLLNPIVLIEEDAATSAAAGELGEDIRPEAAEGARGRRRRAKDAAGGADEESEET